MCVAQTSTGDGDGGGNGTGNAPSIAFERYGNPDAPGYTGGNGIVAIYADRLTTRTVNAMVYLDAPEGNFLGDIAKETAFRDRELLVNLTVSEDAVAMHWPEGTSLEAAQADIDLLRAGGTPEGDVP